MSLDFFEQVRALAEAQGRFSESMGGVFSDPFNESATVVSVSDPKNLGRVKVQFQDGIVSDWSYVLGSQTGQISAQFIGSTCLVAKTSGRSENTFVLGFFNKNQLVGISGQPLQIPLVDGQSGPAQQSCCEADAPGDQGLKCNKENRGRLYVIDTEISQDVVVCVRRNNLQEGTDEVWNWKSLTSSKWIEKGLDPGAKSVPFIADFSDSVGIPACSPAYEGEIHEFSEDKKFRSFPIICRKDENGDWGWSPASAPPVVFRTTLPSCTEKLHGMEAIVDSGDNSQRVTCLRYQGQMKWVIEGKREPLQFYAKDAPLSRDEFLKSKKPMEALQKASATSGALGENAKAEDVITQVGQNIPLTSADSPLFSSLPQTFDAETVLSQAGNLIVGSNIPTDVVQALTSAIEETGEVPESLTKALDLLGASAPTLIRGLQRGDLQGALRQIGTSGLVQAVTGLDPKAQSVLLGTFASGWTGALDTLVMSQLEEFPPVVKSILVAGTPALQSVLDGQPVSVSRLVNSALGELPDFPFKSQLSSLVNLASIQPGGDILSQVSSGIDSFGEVSRLLGSIPGLPTLPAGLSNLPATLSSVTSLVGIGKDIAGVFGGGGLGLDTVTNLLGGVSSARGIISGLVPGAGLLGVGAGEECPCDPKCRKTAHSVDSDGNTLLDPCGNVIANSSSSYSPSGDPTDNNNNAVAAALSLVPTSLGSDLCAGNTLDLTQAIELVKRIKNLADDMEGAKNADFPEFMSELGYTLEAIEKAFKATDNNITGVEDIERKLIDSSFRLFRLFFQSNFSYFSLLLEDVKENAEAIRDISKRVGVLDSVKDGPRKGYKKPTKSISKAIKNISTLPKLKSKTQKEATKVIDKVLKPADRKWKELEPAFKFLKAAEVVLGAIPTDLTYSYDRCETKRNKDKVLADSLSSKLNSPVPPEPLSIFDNLPAESLEKASAPASTETLLEQNILPTVLPRPSSVLDQIEFESGNSSNC